VADGIGDRLTQLRNLRGLAVKELATLSGVAYSDLVALENGARRNPAPDVVRRLAEYFNTTGEYLLAGESPSAAALRAGFFRHHDAMEQGARQALKFAPIQSRVEAVLHFLEGSYPTVFGRNRVAAHLGYTPGALEDVLRGSAPLESPPLRLLAALSGLGLDFFIRGDFFGGVAPEERSIGPERLSEYYQVVLEAAAAGISPGALRRAVQILSIRDEEEYGCRST
jgi:transcriptional regulator with XRE-family HTH domain